jgi:branched-chain amino acid transport system substrate-binding protein
VLVADQIEASDPQQQVVTAYAKDYQAKYNESASMFGGFAYDALNLLVAAWTKNKSADPVRTRDAIETLGEHVGVTGVFRLTATDHLGLNLSAFRMVEIRNGGFVISKK